MTERSNNEEREKLHFPAFRPIPESLADDPNFQRLSPLAKAVWLELRLKLGQYGIAVFYEETLPRMVNADAASVAHALEELTRPYGERDVGWLVRSDLIFWLVDGLLQEVWITTENHWRGVYRNALRLPFDPVVKQYLEYYGLGEALPMKDRPLKAMESRYHSDGKEIPSR